MLKPEKRRIARKGEDIGDFKKTTAHNKAENKLWN